MEDVESELSTLIDRRLCSVVLQFHDRYILRKRCSVANPVETHSRRRSQIKDDFHLFVVFWIQNISSRTLKPTLLSLKLIIVAAGIPPLPLLYSTRVCYVHPHRRT